MMINSVARLCPLLQPVSLFSLPNAPSLADLDWEESSAESGKIHLLDPHVGSSITTCRVQLCLFTIRVLSCAESRLMNELLIGP